MANTNIKSPLTITIPDEAKYIRLTIIPDGQEYAQFEMGSEATEYVPYSQIFVDPKYIIKDGESNKDYVTVGASGCDYTSILAALKGTEDNIKVIVKNGTYNIYEEYKAFYGSTYWETYEGYNGKDDVFTRGLWMGKGRVIEGESQTIVEFKITDTISSASALNAIKTYYAIIADVADDNAIINLTFKGDGNLRYLIHDDFTGYVPQISHGVMIYEHCTFLGTTNTKSLIGGGTGRYNTYIVKDCVFLGDSNVNRDAFWHNHVNADAQPRIIVSGCYGNHLLSFMHNGASTKKALVSVSNCKFKQITLEYTSGQTNENMQVVKWNCTEEG